MVGNNNDFFIQLPSFAPFGLEEDIKANGVGRGKVVEHLLDKAQNMVSDIIFGTDLEQKEIRKISKMSIREMVEY